MSVLSGIFPLALVPSRSQYVYTDQVNNKIYKNSHLALIAREKNEWIFRIRCLWGQRVREGLKKTVSFLLSPEKKLLHLHVMK